ncbi:MAG: hypothetical protein AAF471_08790, partial [Myxococcota bacterium]
MVARDGNAKKKVTFKSKSNLREVHTYEVHKLNTSRKTASEKRHGVAVKTIAKRITAEMAIAIAAKLEAEVALEVGTAAPATVWVVDTGSGNDLISSAEAGTNVRRGPPIRLNTAGGRVTSDYVSTEEIPALGHTFDARILDNTPAVVSVGRRSREGWTFHWAPHQKPVWTDPKGTEHVLEVMNDVPFI